MPQSQSQSQSRPLPRPRCPIEPAPSTKSQSHEQAIELGRKLVADIDRALDEGRRLFEASGLNYRALAHGVKRLHGPAGADQLQRECAKVLAAIEGGDLHRDPRFKVKPASDGKSRRPRNMI